MVDWKNKPYVLDSGYRLMLSFNIVRNLEEIQTKAVAPKLCCRLASLRNIFFKLYAQHGVWTHDHEIKSHMLYMTEPARCPSLIYFWRYFYWNIHFTDLFWQLLIYFSTSVLWWRKMFKITYGINPRKRFTYIIQNSLREFIDHTEAHRETHRGTTWAKVWKEKPNQQSPKIFLRLLEFKLIWLQQFNSPVQCVPPFLVFQYYLLLILFLLLSCIAMNKNSGKYF